MKRIQIGLLIMFSLLLAVPASAQNDNQGPARHDLLALTPSSRDSKTGELLDLTAWSLLQYDPDQIKEFTEQLCTRVNWDIKVVDEMAEGKRPKNEKLEKALVDECNVFVDFILRIGQIAEQHTNVKMKRNNQGEWTYSLTPAPEFETKLWTTHYPQAMKKKDVKAYAACMVNEVYYFCERPLGGGFVPVILDDDELYIAYVSVGLIRNFALVYEYGALAVVKDLFSSDYDKDNFERSYHTCQLYLESVSKAIENNDKIEIEYKPMPKAGAMNASYKTKVLPLEKAVSDKVVDCVVTSDGWEVQRDAAGDILRRVIQGYSIVQTKRGKQAVRVSWAEDHMGGGKYGSIHAYGNGGAQFYVK